MRYFVEVHYRKSPAYACYVEEPTEEQAKRRAINIARGDGFTDPVKRVITVPEEKYEL